MLRISAIAAAALAISSLAAPASAAGGGLEASVLAEVNFARTRPAEYAATLRQGGSEMIGENPRDVAEAIAFLSKQAPLPPLAADASLTAAAQGFASAQGRTGQVGHVSPDGSTLLQRLDAHGVRARMAAENISYGYDSPRAVVRQLIVDTGVPDRGHRTNLFGRNYEAAGVSCAPHKQWGAMCVIDFGGAFPKR